MHPVIIGTGLLLINLQRLLSVVLLPGQLFFRTMERWHGVYQKLEPIQIYLAYNFLRAYPLIWGLRLDPISMMMLLVVVTFISLMVHIYSLGYMKGEERYPTYYAFLGSLYFFHAWPGDVIQYFPDVYFLGAGRCFVLFVDWLLLRPALVRLLPVKKRLLLPVLQTLVF